MGRLVGLVEAEGYRLEAKGRGNVVGNIDGYAKLSSLRLAHTAKDLRTRKRRAEPSTRKTKPRDSAFAVDAIDIARAMVTLGLAQRSTVREAVEAAEAARKVRLEQAPLMVQLLHRLGRATTSLSQPSPNLRRLPRPERARQLTARSQMGSKQSGR